MTTELDQTAPDLSLLFMPRSAIPDVYHRLRAQLLILAKPNFEEILETLYRTQLPNLAGAIDAHPTGPARQIARLIAARRVIDILQGIETFIGSSLDTLTDYVAGTYPKELLACGADPAMRTDSWLSMLVAFFIAEFSNATILPYASGLESIDRDDMMRLVRDYAELRFTISLTADSEAGAGVLNITLPTRDTDTPVAMNDPAQTVTIARWRRHTVTHRTKIRPAALFRKHTARSLDLLARFIGGSSQGMLLDLRLQRAQTHDLESIDRYQRETDIVDTVRAISNSSPVPDRPLGIAERILAPERAIAGPHLEAGKLSLKRQTDGRVIGIVGDITGRSRPGANLIETAEPWISEAMNAIQRHFPEIILLQIECDTLGPVRDTDADTLGLDQVAKTLSLATVDPLSGRTDDLDYIFDLGKRGSRLTSADSPTAILPTIDPTPFLGALQDFIRPWTNLRMVFRPSPTSIVAPTET